MVIQPFLYLTRNYRQQNLNLLCTDMKTNEQAALCQGCISRAENDAFEASVMMNLPTKLPQL
jgi:hypothetical protein